MKLFFEQSWWLPQSIIILCLTAITSLFIFYSFKTWRAYINKKLPKNTMMAIIKEDDHLHVYLHKDAPVSAKDIASAIATEQLEHKNIQ